MHTDTYGGAIATAMRRVGNRRWITLAALIAKREGVATHSKHDKRDPSSGRSATRATRSSIDARLFTLAVHTAGTTSERPGTAMHNPSATATDESIFAGG